MRRWWLALWLFCVGAVEAAAPIGVCLPNMDYPPYRYGATTQDGATRVEGFHMALLDRILFVRGWSQTLIPISQLRCLRELKEGKRVQMFVAGYSEERAREYLLSDPLDDIHFYYFYSKQRFPKGLQLADRSELMMYKVCGITGHNFSMFGLRPESIDMGADSLAAVFAKLARQRCDVLPYNIEVVRGYSFLGQNFLASPDIAYHPIPGMGTGSHRVMISRAWPDAGRLHKAVNEELAILRSNGEYARLAKAYGLMADTP